MMDLSTQGHNASNISIQLAYSTRTRHQFPSLYHYVLATILHLCNKIDKRFVELTARESLVNGFSF
jgi:hypothetical protein